MKKDEECEVEVICEKREPVSPHWVVTWDDEEVLSFVNKRSTQEHLRSNLVYAAGYGNWKQRERMENLLNTPHPVFGFIKEMGIPSSKEAFQCGALQLTLAKLREGIKNGTIKDEPTIKENDYEYTKSDFVSLR
jgi:hypothetical protein